MRTRFITSAPNANVFPDLGLPEVAFVGRSNVGKSSLLNRVANARIARTSKTPGRTQAVNFFEVGTKAGEFVLADLPGYGYARAPKALRRGWYDLIEAYLSQRETLVAVLHLIDLRRGVESEDVEVFDYLRTEAAGEPALFAVGTKADKFAKARRKPALWSIGEALQLDREQLLLCSAQDGLGIDALLARLLLLTGLSE